MTTGDAVTPPKGDESNVSTIALPQQPESVTSTAADGPTPKARNSSTGIAYDDDDDDDDDENQNENENEALSKPITLNRDRDISVTSREGLRRHVYERRMSLTVNEVAFLDRLCIDGNDIEVQLAMEKLQDEDLFFDHPTEDGEEQQDGIDDDGDDDREDEDELKIQGVLVDKAKEKSHADSKEPRSSPIAPRRVLSRMDRSSSMGSIRRIQILSERKKPSQIVTQMWKAHENGLAVTSNASKRGILLREASLSSLGSLKNSQPPPSGIFRRKSSTSSSSNNNNIMKPPMNPKRNSALYHRSQSLTMSRIPPIPVPTHLDRQSSSASRKSVTFHGDTDGTPKPRPSRSSITLQRPLSDMLRQDLSLPIQVPPPQRPGIAQREESSGSIPSLPPGRPIRSESLGSIGSIPSLHHGRPIRDNSTSSIPSLRPGVPLRADSINSIPSLRHGQPIRSTSIGSIPSLRHGHALQSDSDLRYDDDDAVALAWLQQQQVSAQNDATSMQAESSTLPENVSIPSTEMQPSSSQDSSSNRPLLIRRASRNVYEGEGIEVSVGYDETATGGMASIPPPNAFWRTPRRSSFMSMDASVLTSNSFDTSYSRNNFDDVFRARGDDDAMMVRRVVSNDDTTNFFLGNTADLLIRPSTALVNDDFDDDDSSWDMNSDSERYDSWNAIKDEYINGYGGGGTLGFTILGTCADDESAQPHVLSPPLMESLQEFLPYVKSGENFYLKYSMVRDGASMHSFLKRARGCQYSILALETTDGEVFGCFTAQAWRKNWNYFGWEESFLWRMRRSRLEKTHGILEQAQLESEIDVFPCTGENQFIQLCTHDRIAVGGGEPSGEKKTDQQPPLPGHEWGFGLAIQGDFMTGSSSRCVTFGSPPLSKTHMDGSEFEIVNIELWTLTPCLTEGEAEKLELGKLFLERN